ncbi:MAG: hypothetical protein GXX90_09125, partial [Microbacteriaceae bacterium]|nr:hypothetical protein [Microbacteriaceae bacterium]
TDHYRVDWRPATDEATLTVGWLEAPGTRAVHRTAAAELPAADAARPAPAARPRRRDRFRRGLARALPFLAPLLERDADRRDPTAEPGTRPVRLTDGTTTSGTAPWVEYQFAQADAPLAVAVLRELAARDRRLAAADARLTLVAADDVWLSPSYGRDTVALLVRVPAVDRAALDPLEDAFLRAGGLPSWGGLHTITAAEAAHVMPRYGDFVGARHALDPYDRMRNATLRRVLG